MIRRIESRPYVISDTQYSSLPTKTVSFPNRMHGYCCDDWKEAREVKILEASDHTLPQKEKDPGRFTLPCFIYNVCFDKALERIKRTKRSKTSQEPTRNGKKTKTRVKK
ncbi:hypothetical protein Tco_0511198 [Tanacetum coccineum]